MPFHWTGIGSSTAKDRLKELQDACKKSDFDGAAVVGDHVFQDRERNLFVLVKLPDDKSKHDDFLWEIKAKPGGIDLRDTDGN